MEERTWKARREIRWTKEKRRLLGRRLTIDSSVEGGPATRTAPAALPATRAQHQQPHQDLKHSRQLETSKTLSERNLRQSLLVPRVRGRGHTTRAAQRVGQTTKNGLMDPPLIEGRETTITRHLQRTYYNHKGEMIGGINGTFFY